ncbi:response regulator [uncultured Croceitalea sp.]|uniref:response regulator n=1 Tax=uncultured Croceitalea sp. TaxID=1798908 RepID=UPI003305CACE
MFKNYFDIAYVIDDSKIVGKLHSRIIEKLSISQEIKNYHNPVQGLKNLIRDIMAEQKVLLLIDLDMPELNGPDFLEVISELNVDPSKLSIYIISSSISEHLNCEILYHRCVRRHISKPLKKEDLVYQQLKILYKRRNLPVISKTA